MQDARVGKGQIDALGSKQAALGELPVTQREIRIGLEQILQPLMHEAVLPEVIHQAFKIKRLVLQGQGRTLGHYEEPLHPQLELGEQLGDDHRLVAKVVVQIAR